MLLELPLAEFDRAGAIIFIPAILGLIIFAVWCAYTNNGGGKITPIKAVDASKIATDIAKGEAPGILRKDLKNAYSNIRGSANNGRLVTTLDYWICNDAVKHLESDGYIVRRTGDGSPFIGMKTIIEAI